MTATDDTVDVVELFKILAELQALKAQASDLADQIAVVTSRLRQLLDVQA